MKTQHTLGPWTADKNHFIRACCKTKKSAGKKHAMTNKQQDTIAWLATVAVVAYVVVGVIAEFYLS